MAFRMASCIWSALFTFVTPKLEPPALGFTKQGQTYFFYDFVIGDQMLEPFTDDEAFADADTESFQVLVQGEFIERHGLHETSDVE